MYKIMIVDDEAIIRAGIEKMLPRKELDLVLLSSHSNAFDALDSLQDGMPDILISDIKLPKMDGIELIGRALKMYPTMQVIVISGFDDFEFARSAMKLGVKEYLLKPCDKKELFDAISRTCVEIDKHRRIVNKTIDQRREWVDRLTEELITLGRKASNEQQIRSGLAELMKSCSNEEVLVESVIRLVAVDERRIASAQWQIEIIQKIYQQKDVDIVGCIAEILQQVYSNRKARHGFVEKMCAFIQENYMNPDLTIQYVADHVVHMNADYIGKEFSNDTGLKFSKYLLKVRIKHAKKLIAKNPQIPFYEVADKVGYGGNQQYFSQMFKKETNMTPKEFRNEVMSENG